MRKVYFRTMAGSIGLESLNAKVFSYYIDFLRNNGLEPVVVLTVRPHNSTLRMLIKRKYAELGIRVIDISYSKSLCIFYHRIIMRSKIQDHYTTKSYLDFAIKKKSHFAQVGATSYDFEPINESRISLDFLEKEKRSGRETFEAMGGNKSFVCVHARDSCFYQQKNPEEQTENRTSSRNISFKAYLQACTYLERCGIQSLRMGAVQAEVKESIFNENIIDYAGKYRTEFMDIWSIANCKFFLGNSSGLFVVSYLFNKPNAVANFENFLSAVPYHKNDIYIPQKIWHRRQKRFLTYIEISENNIGTSKWTQERYSREGLKCIKSDSEEITELAQEMNDVLDGRYKYTAEDDNLQKKFRSIFKTHHAPHHSPARVGKEFLKRNRDLFLVNSKQ